MLGLNSKVNVRTGVFHFIEKLYDLKRLHSAPGLGKLGEYEKTLSGENRKECR